MDKKIEEEVREMLVQYFDQQMVKDADAEADKKLRKLKNKYKIDGAKSFARIVKKMRELQRMFFNGDRTVLDEAKGAEQKVDKALKTIYKSYDIKD